MFISIFKTTLKNLFRSITFWLALCVFIIVAIQNSLGGFHAVYNMELKELIFDTDPRYILEYRIFIQWINNCVSALLNYIIPIFSVVSTVIILNRDYGDHFYEIEKAGGIKSSCYVLGRISALLTINGLLSFIISFLGMHLYVFTRGGVSGMELWDYIVESAVRLLRIDIFRILPCILFYICLTYLIGALFKNKIFAAIGGMGFAVYCYANSLFTVNKAGLFIEYLSPDPMKLSTYFHYYDTEWFEDITTAMNTSLTDAAICIAFLIGVGVLCSVLSYFLIRKRST